MAATRLRGVEQAGHGLRSEHHLAVLNGLLQPFDFGAQARFLLMRAEPIPRGAFGAIEREREVRRDAGQHRQIAVFELARGGAAGEIERAQASAFDHQRLRERRQRRGRFVPRGGVHGRELRLSRGEGARAQFVFIRREIGSGERAPARARRCAGGVRRSGGGRLRLRSRRGAGLEQRDARRAEQREHARDDGLGEFGGGVADRRRVARRPRRALPAPPTGGACCDSPCPPDR